MNLRRLRRYIGRKAMVTTSAESFAGTIVSADGDLIELSDVERVANGQRRELGGRLLIPSATVTSVQVV